MGFCRTSLSNSICYITQTVDRSLNIGWPSRHEGTPMHLVASRNIWFGDSIIPLRLTAASTFCTQKLFAFAEYCNNVMGPPESYSMWNQRAQTVPEFKFWSMIIELELLMVRFVRSLREGDFPLYVQSCDELRSWFHALDHTKYARWFLCMSVTWSSLHNKILRSMQNSRRDIL